MLEEFMTSNLEELCADLAHALREKDAARINEIRSQLGEAHSQSDAGAEANFRLGVSGLMAGQDVDQAIARLRQAAKAKHPTWTPQARLSLGLLLKAQGKEQQALFELRKVAMLKTASLASAQALGFMVIMQEDAGQNEEAKRTRSQHHQLLSKLIEGSESEISSLAHYMLGMDLKYTGARQDAKKHLELALKCGGLAEDESARVQDALSTI
jgi:tetratricopeptide (TPR) repeat protein